jgi:hypothetical protein
MTDLQLSAAPSRLNLRAVLDATMMTIFLGTEAAVVMAALVYFFTGGWLQYVAIGLAAIAEAWVLFYAFRRAYVMELELKAQHAENTTHN